MCRILVVFLFFAVMLSACKSGKQKGTQPNVDSTTTLNDPSSAVKDTTLAQTNEPYQLTGPLNTSFAEYIDLDANGDDELLTVTNQDDTTQYLVRTTQTMPKLTKGDQIKIEWKKGTYRPAGDPETAVDARFVVAYELVKLGKLASAKRKGMMPRVSYFYDPEMSDYGKEQIDREIRYYLANTVRPEVRAAVKAKSDLLCTVRQDLDHTELYDIMINFDEDKPQPLQRVQFRFDKPYQLREVMP